MALEIQEKYGIHSVFGDLNSKNVNLVKNHILKLMTFKDQIYLSLERVKTIDSSSAKTLETLYKEAASRNIVLSIFGLQNQNINSLMKESKTHYILSSDRV